MDNLKFDMDRLTADGSEVFVLKTPRLTSAQLDHLQRGWKAAWESSAKTPPPLMVLEDTFSIEKMRYDGDGIFILQLPHDVSSKFLDRFRYYWDSVWIKSRPVPPVALLPADTTIGLLSDADLKAAGLIRIPEYTVEF